MNKFIVYIHRHVFPPSQDSSVRLALIRREQKNGCGAVNEEKIFCSHQCYPEWPMKIFRAYIHRHVFPPSQDSLVCLELTRREKLM